MTSIRKNKVFMIFLYTLVFLLLAEWLTPVIVLTETNYKALFLLFIGASLVMAVLQVPWWVSGPLKLFYIGWFVSYVYMGSNFPGLEELTVIWTDLMINFSALFYQNWAETTDMFRTFLFFSLLWMAVYLIHYWVSFRLSIFMFYLLTVIFVAVLDTFSPYTGNTAIIRIMVIGLMLAGLLHLARWLETHRVPMRPKLIVGWVLPLLLTVAASTVFAMYLPKADPVWPDPVPFLQSYATGSGSAGAGEGAIRRIGYDQDDSQLGGSFVGDNTPVFQVETNSPQYWKIESKDVYTTKGWELSDSEADPSFYGNGDTVEMDYTAGVPEDQREALVTMQDIQFPFVLYPYGTRFFEMEEPTDYRYNPADQRIGTYRADSTFEPDQYEVFYSEPSFSLTALRATTPEQLANLPAEFDRYLQLPQELPQRVRDLSAEITSSQTSVYDKARAIERYFAMNNFTYTQQDVPIPAENQDYVDQFLFETQRGYCDNFSTAMVVMLRSLDIPARWVKGFNEGEEMRTPDGRTIYQIRNNNAHSWVEAYMPGVGWMMFEPTIGFTGASEIEFDLEVDPAAREEVPVPEAPELEKPEAEEAAAAGNSQNNSLDLGARFSQFWSEYKNVALWVLPAVLLAALILYRLRQKWLPKVLIPYYRFRKEGEDTFEKAYLRLLRQLRLYGIERKEGQTLSSYAAYIDNFFGTHDMSRLTNAYEQSVYGGSRQSVEWERLRESWEYLINRTSG